MEKTQLDTPLVITKSFTYTHFKIKDIIITLNQTAKFIVILYGDDDNDVKEILMNETEYAVWGVDDNYVINFIKTKLLE
jgi:hypothetical protein